MNLSAIILAIDGEIAKLQYVKAVLTGAKIKSNRGRPAGSVSSKKASRLEPQQAIGKPKSVRTLSVESRAKMADAQKRRWAKKRGAGKEQTASIVAVPTQPMVKNVSSKRTSAKKSIPAKRVGRPRTKNLASAS